MPSHLSPWWCVSRNVLLNDVSVLPAELVAQSADSAVLLARPQAEHTECLGDHHPLLAVIWRWDTLKGF